MTERARPFRFGVVAVSPRPSMAEWVSAASRFESLGDATIHLSDHFDRSPVAPLPMLAALATTTTTLTLGTLVLDNDFRHPAVLAKELATLDLIAPGRLEIGLGAGWMHADYTVSGIPFDRVSVRINRMEESLAILDEVLSSPHCLLGTVDEIVERVLSLRAQFGISYVSMYDTVADEMAPVVAALAGR